MRETQTEFEFNWFSDDIAQRLAKGDAVTADEYVARFPNHADEIREAFPVLCVLAEHGTTPEDHANSPEHINGYRIVREIGRGGMGIVYEASHPKLSRKMAIKVLTPAQAGKTTLQERFAREAETASRLSHPNIVPLFDFGEADGQSFLVMPFVEGRSLDEILNEHWSHHESPAPLAVDVGPRVTPASMIARDFRRIATLGAGVASALAHAHEQQTIHRDIKPANLLLDNNRKVWVTDFGLAKLRDADSDLSTTGDIIGTPRYMAPEQIRGQSDERSDIYSLGVTLWELASGARAWHAINNGDMLSVKSAFELPAIREINPNVPQALATIIGRCCAFHPRDRFQTADDLQQSLNRFAHDGGSDRRFMSRETLRRAATSRFFLTTIVICLFALSALLIYSHRPDSIGSDKPTEHANSADNHSPIICGPTSFSRQLDTSAGSFQDLWLTAIDPDEDTFSWQLLDTETSGRFFTQRLSGHLCVRKADTSLLRHDRETTLRIAATDTQRPHIAVYLKDERGEIIHADPVNDDFHSTQLPGQMLGIWTTDGSRFQHIHRANDGTVAIYESTLDRQQKQLSHTTLLQSDTHLPPTVLGMTQHLGRFLCVVETRDGAVLQWFATSKDHVFRPWKTAIPLPATWRPTGISCLGEFDFQITQRQDKKIRFAEIAVDHDQILGLRESMAGWMCGDREIIGSAAWLTQHGTFAPDDEAIITIKLKVSDTSQTPH